MQQHLRAKLSRGGMYSTIRPKPAHDACHELGLSPIKRALPRLDLGEHATIEVTNSIGQKESLPATTESGLYRLIFTRETPLAEEFKDWLFTKHLAPIMAERRRELIFLFEHALAEIVQLTILQDARESLVFFDIQTLRRFCSLAKTKQVREVIDSSIAAGADYQD